MYRVYTRDGVSGWRARVSRVMWIWLFWDIVCTALYALNNKNREMGDETRNRLQKNKGYTCYFLSCGEKNLLYHFILYYVHC